MPVRRPLVLVNGCIKELSSEEVLDLGKEVQLGVRAVIPSNTQLRVLEGFQHVVHKRLKLKKGTKLKVQGQVIIL